LMVKIGTGIKLFLILVIRDGFMVNTSSSKISLNTNNNFIL
jgi:hypothetical protein